MIEAIVKRGTLVVVIVLMSCILGIVAAINIPVQMIPDLEVRTISVQTGWPGATPHDIEKEILLEQEQYLRSLPNLQRMTSSASFGEASIELEFPFGVDESEALIRVSNALSQVPDYPENVDQPRLIASAFSSNPFIFFVLSTAAGNPMELDIDMLADYADDYIRPRLESVEGVSQVEVWGGSPRQVQVDVDMAKLANRGLSLVEVRNAIRARNTDSSAGDLEQGQSRFLVRVVGRFEQLEELGNLIVSRSGNANIYLKDIADIRLDHFETRSKAFSDGQRSLTVPVRRESSSNVLEIKEQMLPLVESLNNDVLIRNGLELKWFSDDVQYVSSSLKNVWVNLGLGALLATLVMLYFLRSGRSTLIGVIGIPICTIAAFLALSAFGRTINVISLAGVAFAIGMTVDNTIVVLESITQHLKAGKSRFQAAVDGVREVWPAVLASTATTVLVFAPILFIVQEAGQLYSDIAIAISGAIIASMLVAIFVVPVAMAALGKDEETSAKTPDLSKKWMTLVAVFCRSKARARGYAVGFALAVLGIAYVVLPAAEYLPEGEEPKAFSMMFAPPNYNLSEMEKIGDDLITYFENHLNVSPQAFESGETTMPPITQYNMSVSAGNIWFLSAPVNPDYIDEMMTAITEKFTSYENMRAFSARGSIISSNDGGTRAVAIDLSGNNLEDLYAAAEAVYSEAEVVFNEPQLNSDPSSLILEQPLIEIRPRWQRLAEIGISNEDFGYTVAAKSDGAYVDEIILNDDKIDIFLFSHAGNQQSIDELAASPLITPQGDILPLNALADLTERKNSDSLRRVDGNRTVTVYIIPERKVALETAEAMVRDELLPALWQRGDIAQGISVGISGAADQLEQTRASLLNNFVIAVALCFLLLVAIFTHWGYPVFILATVPLGMAGGLLGLVMVNGVNSLLSSVGLGWTHQPFDMITMLGFLILLGTVINNPILIVDQTRRFLATGEAVKTAVKKAVKKRLKPILMSTATTVFGLSPLILIPGEGTELYRGIGIIVLCGIFSSTILSLTFLPALLTGLLKQRDTGRQAGR